MMALQQARLAPLLGTVIFLLFFANFAVKLPAVPFHTWLLDAQGEAPAPIAVLLTGVALKTGGYGLLRINLAGFPAAARQLSWLLVGLAVAGVLWGSLAALVEDDLRRLVGYSSVASMGLVLLAGATRSAIALNGAVLLLFAQGLVAALLILLVSAIEERTRTRSLRALGGLAARTPQLAIVALLAALAALGIPGLVSFIAHFEIFLGSYPEQHLATALCLLGLVLGAGYLLTVVRRTFFGPIKEAFLRLHDLEPVETAWASILLVPIFMLGLFPQLLVERIGAGVSDLAIRLGHP
jgi:NADH-quinone oxidoreductase subunit M